MPAFVRASRTSFRPAACLRIALASAAVTLAVYAAAEIWLRPAMPAFQFNWLNGLANSIGGFLFMVAIIFVIRTVIPPRITVTRKGIIEQHGEDARLIKHADIIVVHVVLRRDDRHFIRVETAKHSRRFGLGSGVSLFALEDHFGDKLVVHDRRREPAERYSSLLKQ